MLTRHDLRSIDGDYAAALPRPMDDADAPLDIVRDIIADVRHRGDDAINELGARFDGAAAKPLKLGPEDLAAAVERVDPAIIESLREAAASIKAFHVSQIDPAHSYQHKGMTITQNRQPVDRAGCYVPGGRAWYPSTVLMTAVIARAAGVREVVVCVPPKGDGKVIDVTLAAASIAEVDTVYACGGAQAIAAMAYGTETIDPVDVIVGPGNVFRGPSET